MSIANLLEPNNYNLFCNTITTGSTGSTGPSLVQFGGGQSYVNIEYDATTNSLLPVLFDSVTTQGAIQPFTYSGGTFTAIKECNINLNYQVTWQSDSIGYRQVCLSKNGTTVQENISLNNATSMPATQQIVSGSSSLYLNVGDTFQILSFQNSTNPLFVIGKAASGSQYTLVNYTYMYN
jgi:hypothetical protein